MCNKHISILTDCDADGLGCNYILGKNYPDSGFRGIHFHGENDWFDGVNNDTKVLIYADIFLPVEYWNDPRLQNIEEVIIFDHHVSGYKEFTKFILDNNVELVGTHGGGTNFNSFVFENTMFKYYYSSTSSATGIASYIYQMNDSVFQHINNNDIWKHECPEDKWFGIGIKQIIRDKSLSIKPFNYTPVDRLFDELCINPSSVIELGKEKEHANIEQVKIGIEQKRYTITLDKFNNKALIVDFSINDTNIALEYLYQNYDVDYVIRPTASCLGRFYICSLRSLTSNGYKCNELASRYGGGGHVSAAGCKLSFGEFYDLFPNI